MDQFRIGLIEDDPYYISIIKTYFDHLPTFNIEWNCQSKRQLQRSTLAEVDVILLDINLPDTTGIELYPEVQSRWPESKIIFLTVQDDAKSLVGALSQGAMGFVLKNEIFSYLETAIKEVLKGRAFICPGISPKLVNYFQRDAAQPEVPASIEGKMLTDKERAVVEGLVNGLAYKQIAAERHISIETVRGYVKTIYRKFDVHSRAKLIYKVNQELQRRGSSPS